MPWNVPDDEGYKKRLEKHCIISESGCWEWQGKLTFYGYGMTTYHKKEIVAHRLSYKLFVGPIPEKMMICHHCDNRKCINPKHLFIGTHQDNMDDGVKKKRFLSGEKWRVSNWKTLERVGEKHQNSKLTKTTVLDILELSKLGLSYKEIGSLFNVSMGTVGDAVKGRTWSKALEQD